MGLICADGNVARECYVADLALPPGIKYEPGDLLHGRLRERYYPVVDTRIGVLQVDFVYFPVLRAKRDRGRYSLIHDTGIVCIMIPCPSRVIRRLNGKKKSFHRGVFFGAGSQEEIAALKEAFQDEYNLPENHGALVMGRLRKIRDKKLFKVRNVYTTKIGRASCRERV